MNEWETTNKTHPEGLMTMFEVSRRLRCSLSNAYNLVAIGKLKAFRVGAGNSGLRVSEKQL